MFDNIVIFTQLVEIGNYVRTADFLNISPPTLTRKIQELERFCGKLLLLRDTRNVTLTEEGEILYQEYKDLRQRLNSVYHTISNTGNNNTGKLTIVLPLVRSIELISPFINHFTHENPEIKLNLIYQHGHLDKLHDNVDIALLNKKINDDKYDCKLLRNEYIQLYCTPEYAHKFGVPLNIDHLQDHNLVGGVNLDHERMDYAIFINHYTNESIVYNSKKDFLKVNNILHSLQIGLNSEHIFPCWNHLCEGLVRSGKLIHILPEYYTYKHYYYLISRKKPRPEEQLFIDFIYHCMNKMIIPENNLSY